MSTSRDGVDWRTPTIYLVIATAVVGPMDTPLISPVLPGAQAAFELTDAQVGLFITALALPGVVSAPLIGMAADRYGRTRILVGCLALYGLAGSAVPFVGTFPTVLALRFVQGMVGSSILGSLAMTLVGDFYAGRARNAAMGVLGGATTLAVAVYPTIGGFLADISWELPFYLYGVSTLLAIVVAFGLEEPEGERSQMGLSYLRAAVAAVPTRRALALYGAAIGSFLLVFGGVFTAVPLLLDGEYGLAASRIGLITTLALLATAVVSVLNGRLAAWLSNRSLLALGFVGYGLGLVGAGLAPNPTLLTAALVAFGVGHGLTFPTLATTISSLADSRFRAGVLSIRTSMLMLGQAVGPWLFPKLGSWLGYPTLLAWAGALSLLVGGLALVSFRYA